MASITVQGADLVVDVHGLHKLWALKSRLTIPDGAIHHRRGPPEPIRSSAALRGSV